MGAYLKTGTGVTATDFASSAAFHTRAGYLALTNTAATVPATATTLSSSGHIFGRLGQGLSTIPG